MEKHENDPKSNSHKLSNKEEKHKIIKEDVNFIIYVLIFIIIIAAIAFAMFLMEKIKF